MSHDEGSTQFGYEDHKFTPARTRKKRKNRPQAAPPSPDVLLDRASEELARSDWLRDTLQSLRESLEAAFGASAAARDVLCLGLGAPAASRDARAQLAFLLAACDDLSIDRARVSVYDPVFAEQDTQLLRQLGLTALPENRQASYGLRSPTIVFMPHCDLHLYENILRENWTRARLPNVLLIANRLREYAENIPSRKLASEHPCVARLVPHLESRALQPCAPFPTAFNNTAMQFVRSDALAHRDADWWALHGDAPAKEEAGETPRAPDARDTPQAPSSECARADTSVRPDTRPNAAPAAARGVTTTGPASKSKSPPAELASSPSRRSSPEPHKDTDADARRTGSGSENGRLAPCADS